MLDIHDALCPTRQGSDHPALHCYCTFIAKIRRSERDRVTIPDLIDLLAANLNDGEYAPGFGPTITMRHDHLIEEVARIVYEWYTRDTLEDEEFGNLCLEAAERRIAVWPV